MEKEQTNQFQITSNVCSNLSGYITHNSFHTYSVQINQEILLRIYITNQTSLSLFCSKIIKWLSVWTQTVFVVWSLCFLVTGTFSLVLTETKVINWRKAPWWDPKKQNKLFWSLTIHLRDARTMETNPDEVNELICESYSTSSKTLWESKVRTHAWKTL